MAQWRQVRTIAREEGWPAGRWLRSYFEHDGGPETTDTGMATVTYLARQWAEIKEEPYEQTHWNAVLDAARKLDSLEEGLVVEQIDGNEWVIRTRRGLLLHR